MLKVQRVLGVKVKDIVKGTLATIARAIRRKLINRLRKLKKNSDLINNTITEEKNLGDNNCYELLATETDNSSAYNTSTEGFITPDNYSTSDFSAGEMEHENEDQMLLTIASNMKETTTEELEARMQHQMENFKKQLAQQPTPAEKQMEVNTDENPQMIALSSVMQMFKQLQEEVGDIKSKQSKVIFEQLEQFRSSIQKEVTEALEYVNIENTNLKLEAEVKHWKHKSQVLTEVIERQKH